jgi:glycosyltransferase involved in cell wall biosynthesis
MRIAFVSQPLDNVIPPNQNSIGIWMYEVARRLAQSQEVTIYAKWMRTSQSKAENQGNVRYRLVRSVPSRAWTRLYDLLSGYFTVQQPLFASSFYYLEYILQVALDLRVRQYDIVHLFNFSQFVPIIRMFNPNIKIVLRMSCEWLTQLDPTMIERRLREVDLVIGCSEYITDKIRHCFPQFADRCQTVYNGRDVHYFVPKNGYGTDKNDGTTRLLFVGRISPEKGVHILLDAFQKVVERYPQVVLEIVGWSSQLPFEFFIALSDDKKVSDLVSFYDGASQFSYFNYLQERVSSQNLVNQVIFTGPVPHSELINHYRSSDIFIFPSIWDEPSGNPPIEAMSVGIPVISTNTGGTPEYVLDGKTGLLVDPNNASALTEAILRLLDNKDLRTSMGEAGRKRAVELFSYERLVEDLSKYYENISDTGRAND